ncbi:unnamed protein product [Amoebophrya sp. A120]|nr:unnamed protein product [Amoebophrya sp. A120]|eukprot:GSA120T00006402001.1
MQEVFRPGTKVVTYPENLQGAALGATVVQSSYTEEISRASGKTRRTFVLMLEFIVSVGDTLAFVGISEPYSEFEGSQPLKAFRHRPLATSAQPNVEEARMLQALIVRGMLYAEIATGYHYLQYGPDTFFPVPVTMSSSAGSGGRATRPLQATGRIMVDNTRAGLEGHNPTRGADGASVSVREALRVYEQAKRTGGALPVTTFTINDEDFHHDQLFACWPMVLGFSFSARCWGKLVLVLENTRPIKFQKHAFEQLVLPAEKKELIRACARYAGKADEDGEVDVIANKGGASIFLLYGPPGCGKTLTAEAIAEMLSKPLYTVTAGDLGITAAEVEKTLSQVLQMCAEWNALVLIDEADIFIEARTSQELQRNAIVCVMLRLLEYYSGGLFLTTNRVGNIDPAVSSRITVMLGYEALDFDGRAKVWRNLLLNSKSKHVQKILKTEDLLSQLANYVLNGRQIKNSILLARALAKERGEELSMQLLERAVLAVAGERSAAEQRHRLSSISSDHPHNFSPTPSGAAFRGSVLASPVDRSFVPH